MFLLRTNCSQEVIGTIFSITQREVSRYCEQARSALMSQFVPCYLGPNQIKGEAWLDHNTTYLKEFFFEREKNGFNKY